ncbi:MAG: ATP-binding protein [Candidatus Omnitrophota bacterium]
MWLNVFGVGSICIVISSILMGITVFAKSQDKKLGNVWGFFCIAVTLFGIGTFMVSIIPASSYSNALFWWQVAYQGAIFSVVFFSHYVINYLKLDKKIFIRSIYFMAFVFSFFNWYKNSEYLIGNMYFVFGQFYCPDWIKYKNPIWLVMYITFFIFLLGYTFWLLLRSYLSSPSADRNQLKYFMLGSVFGWVGAHADFLICFRVPLYPFLHFCVAFYTIIFTYAIVRYQLMAIEVIVRKTLVFAGLLASVFAMLILPTLILQEYIFRSAGAGGKIVGFVISGIIIILTMHRIESFLINVTDKYLFQKKYDYKALLRTFTNEVLTVLELDKLVNLTVDKLSDIIKLNSAAVLLFNEEEQQFEVAAQRNVKDPDVKLIRPDGIVTFMEATQGYLLVKELIARKISIPAAIREIIDKLSAELVIPMVMHEKLIGILSLGKKKSDEDYSEDDLDILLPLARTLAIAISNAQLFDELGKTQADAAQKDKMAVIGTLSAGINHEICNPLGIARGQCEAFLLNLKDGLYKSKTNEELLTKAREIMAKVIHETDRATAITKKLSQFAKPSKGDLEWVNVEKEVDDVLGLVGYELKLEKIEFEKHISTTLPQIFVDRKQLQEVLFNLVRNAGQAIGEKGKVIITAKEERNKVIIDIKDTGSGIPPDKVKELFNPFFTTKEPGKGTGLGLFIVSRVVERNGGRIYLKETKVGEGTTFTLEFPVASKSEVTQAEKS